jgi:hypothetical protein
LIRSIPGAGGLSRWMTSRRSPARARSSDRPRAASNPPMP